MTRRIFAITLVVLLPGCDTSSKVELSSEEQSVVQAVLNQLEDGRERYEKFADEYPEEIGLLDPYLDQRICVKRETEGPSGEMDGSGLAKNDPDRAEKWIRATERRGIPANILPDHLQWDSPFSNCAGGTVILGTPRISARKARVYFSFLGYGTGEKIVERIDGNWEVTESRWLLIS